MERKAEALPGGGGNGVVPNGASNVPFLMPRNWDTNGGSTVTPKGPLTPLPALGEK